MLNPYTQVRGGGGGWTGGHRPPGSQAQAEEGGQTQVSCDWLGAGHVTSMLTSDWSRVCHVACPDIAATMPKIDARRLDGKKHRTSSALRGNMGLK